MKRKRIINAPGWVAAVAAQFHVDDRTARRWRRQGCPEDMTKLRAWLASRRQLPVAAIAMKPVTGSQVAAPTDAEQEGAAPALTRMARQELTCWRTLQAAIETGDPIAVKTAHQQWLQTADTLRRLDIAVEVARRDSGQLIPLTELRRVFSLLLLGVRLQLSKHGEHIANDALIAGILPLLANEQDRWLHDQINADVRGWVAQSEAHISRALVLYCEALAALRAGATTDDDEGRALAGLINRALAKMKDLPPVLPREEYERKAYEEILARYRRDHPEEYAQ